MAEGAVLDLFRGCLQTIMVVAAPFVLCSLVVGLVASLVQAATQLQENALSFVPKIVAIGALLVLVGPWALARLVDYERTAFNTIVTVGRGQRR